MSEEEGKGKSLTREERDRCRAACKNRAHP